jgi:putative inorganic carbon (HCO3(-)) transporter
MLVVPGIWMVGLMAGRDPLRRTPLNLSLLILAVMVLVSLYATYDLAESFARLATMVLEFGLYFGIVRYGMTKRGWWTAFVLFLAVGLGVAGLGLISAPAPGKFGFLTALVSHVPLVRTSLLGADQSTNSNQVAGTILWTIPVLCVLSILVVRRFRAMRAAVGAVLALVLLALVLTTTVFVTGVFILMQSRSGYIGLAVGMFGLGFVVLWSRGKRFAALGTLVLALLLAVGFLALAPQAALQNGWGVGSSVSGSSMESFEGRLEVWSRALYGIQDFPFTGMGMDTFRRVVNVLYPLFTIGPDAETIHAHNEYLESALDLGIPGLIAFVALYLGSYAMLNASWRAVQSGTFYSERPTLDGLEQSLILGLGTGLLAHMIFGLTDATIFVARYDTLFWMLLGLIAGLYEQARSGELSQWRELFVRAPVPPPPETLG